VLTAEEDDIAGLGLRWDLGASTGGVDPALALVVVLLGSREVGERDPAVGGVTRQLHLAGRNDVQAITGFALLKDGGAARISDGL